METDNLILVRRQDFLSLFERHVRRLTVTTQESNVAQRSLKLSCDQTAHNREINWNSITNDNPLFRDYDGHNVRR